MNLASMDKVRIYMNVVSHSLDGGYMNFGPWLHVRVELRGLLLALWARLVFWASETKR